MLGKLGDVDEKAFRAWLPQVLHDLVKYLEMMPRSLDWDALEEEDLELLEEAVLETRSSREGVESALEVWTRCLNAADDSIAAHPEVTRLGEVVTQLDADVQTMKTTEDAVALRPALFTIGDTLRAWRDSLS